MVFYKTMKAVSVTLILASLSQTALAAQIPVSDVFNNWTNTSDMVGNSNEGAWALNSNSITATGNHRGSLVSDVVLDADFSFSLNSIARDNDSFGMLWGYQDANNHYRFTWAQDWGESGSGTTNGGSGGIYDGFKIIKETNGISSVLFSSDLEYGRNYNYDFSVSGTSTGFDLSVKNLTTSTSIFNQSIADTTHRGGRVGIHEYYQDSGNAWSNFNVTASVPEPSTLAVFALGMLGLASRRMNKKI